MDKTETVLVVDDEPVVRNFVRMVLAREGYTVLDAKTFEEAVAICEALNGEKIQLLIVDHGLPPKNGKALALEILKRCPAVSVIIISGWPFEVVLKQDGLMPGAIFLPKPFTSQRLREIVGDVFRPRLQ